MQKIKMRFFFVSFFLFFLRVFFFIWHYAHRRLVKRAYQKKWLKNMFFDVFLMLKKKKKCSFGFENPKLQWEAHF